MLDVGFEVLEGGGEGDVLGEEGAEGRGGGGEGGVGGGGGVDECVLEGGGFQDFLEVLCTAGNGQDMESAWRRVNVRFVFQDIRKPTVFWWWNRWLILM